MVIIKRTDIQTDRLTDAYRDARTHLKTLIMIDLARHGMSLDSKTDSIVRDESDVKWYIFVTHTWVRVFSWQNHL